jgi:acyl-CoA synthetase (AMP-forming)/AMP-acid ligase II/thioesterase domain-containing protein
MSEPLPGPRTIPELLAHRANASRDSPAVASIGRPPLGYGGLREVVARTAAGLRARGIGRHDRVALVLPNGPQAAIAFLGVASAAACAPLNPAYTESELDFYLGDLQARAVVADPEDGAFVTAVARERGIAVLALQELLEGDPAGASEEGLARPEDVALVLHTSGTTSRPKLVPLTHANLCASARNVATALDLSERDRCLNVMPLFHVHGLVAAVLGSLEAGASVVCTPGFHAPSFAAWLEELAPTWYTAVPTIHQAVLARRTGGNSRHGLRFVRSSSAPLSTRLAGELEAALGVPVIEAYGMTEAAHQISSNALAPAERRLGSVGRAAGPEIAILDDEGLERPPGAIGEVAIRGPNVFAGYERNPQANALAFWSGWFRTGDEGYLDEDGYLFLHGRLTEIINRGGEKVAPGEVEEALLAHPAVAQAVAFAVPDARLGDEVAAAVVLRDGTEADERELQRFVAGRLADFKVPRVVAVEAEIPTGPTGKLQRRGMAERLGIGERGSGNAGSGGPRTRLERRLATLWKEILDLDEVGVDDDFFAAGGDSILATELVSRLADDGYPDLSLTTLVWAPTVSRLAAELEKGRGDPSAALVPIQTRGGRRPLFFVHALDGEVVRFAALARCLGPDQPFYGLKAIGVEARENPHGRIEDMAAHYLAEVRAVQPQGPYLLGALCMGGPIAIEMARALIAAGEAVPLLALVDPHVPGPPPSLARRVTATILRTRRETVADVYAAYPNAYLRRMAEIRDAYVMSPFPGRVAVYVSDQHAELGWLSLVEGGAEIHALGGTHMELLRRPAVERLAEHIRQGLAAAGDAEHGPDD